MVDMVFKAKKPHMHTHTTHSWLLTAGISCRNVTIVIHSHPRPPCCVLILVCKGRYSGIRHCHDEAHK